jgi:hypothetical protein
VLSDMKHILKKDYVTAETHATAEKAYLGEVLLN